MLLAVAARQTDNSERKKKTRKNQWKKKYIYIYIIYIHIFLSLGGRFEFFGKQKHHQRLSHHISTAEPGIAVVVPGQED